MRVRRVRPRVRAVATSAPDRPGRRSAAGPAVGHQVHAVQDRLGAAARPRRRTRVHVRGHAGGPRPAADRVLAARARPAGGRPGPAVHAGGRGRRRLFVRSARQGPSRRTVHRPAVGHVRGRRRRGPRALRRRAVRRIRFGGDVRRRYRRGRLRWSDPQRVGRRQVRDVAETALLV